MTEPENDEAYTTMVEHHQQGRLPEGLASFLFESGFVDDLWMVEEACLAERAQEIRANADELAGTLCGANDSPARRSSTTSVLSNLWQDPDSLLNQLDEWDEFGSRRTRTISAQIRGVVEQTACLSDGR